MRQQGARGGRDTGSNRLRQRRAAEFPRNHARRGRGERPASHRNEGIIAFQELETVAAHARKAARIRWLGVLPQTHTPGREALLQLGAIVE